MLIWAYNCDHNIITHGINQNGIKHTVTKELNFIPLSWDPFNKK